MTLNATVQRLVLTSPDTKAAADFYRSVFGYTVQVVGDEHHCQGPQRALALRPGPTNQLAEVHFRFTSPQDFARFRQGLSSLPPAQISVSHPAEASLQDPEGRQLRFRLEASPVSFAPDALPEARLQHFAVRSPRPAALAEFYARIGFVVSDRVHDEAGELSAVFLRTDAEHHALAIFRSAEARFDHFSCETTDWHALRAWADRMASVRVPMAWGIGRHGPGNDTFFMVRDPDGNLAEISCDLEQCAEDRAPGVWPHEPRTLNLWGSALMRS